MRRVRGISPELQAAARELRRQMTPAEARLWEALRDRRLAGLKFRRQHGVGTSVLDFYCRSAKLVVEVKEEMKAKGIEKPIVASLAGDVEVEEAAEYLYQNGVPAYAYSTELPVEVLGAKYKWARGAGLL